MVNNLPSCLRCAGLLSALTLAGPAQAICYSTPRLAIDSALSSGASSPAATAGGYRVVSVQSDPVLRQRWAMVVNCAHPEWPAIAMQARDDDSLKAMQPIAPQSAIVVHIGDIVRLWRQESLSRVEVAGVSEGSGAIGETIRVRLLHSSSEEQPRQLLGVVRGPSDVEMRQ
jgi:hypothetical protein